MNNELLEVLELYYDSHEQHLLDKSQENQQIVIDVSATAGTIDGYEYHINYNYTFKINNLPLEDKLGRYSAQLVDQINTVVPDFIPLILQEHMPAISKQDAFEVSFLDQKLSLYSQHMRQLYPLIFAAYCKGKSGIPLSYNFTVTIKRSINTEYRRIVAAHRRHDKLSRYHYGDKRTTSCKEFADQLINSRSHSGYGQIRNMQVEGEIKRRVYNLSKEAAVFAVEYLYGHKLNKTCKFGEIGQYLSNCGNQDFGLRDVQQLYNLYVALGVSSSGYRRHSNTDIYQLYSSLQQVAPSKSDLKRWKKIIQAEIEAQAQKQLA